MKRIQRLPLSVEALTFLHERSAAVAAAANARAEAGRLWGLQDNQAFREIRETLGKMASGLERCMYCEDSEGTAIEHFWPKSTYPERAFDWLNYLIACSRCNSNCKRDLFPLDGAGAPLLVNPCEEEPLDHLSFSPSTGRFEPKSPKGDPSITVFGLNRTTLTKGRASAWTVLEQLLVRYAEFKDAGRDAKAEKIETAVRSHPFAGVFVALLWMASGPDADLLIDQDCLRVLRGRSEISTWT
ncbi:MAG: HNH endonuclease [Thermoanaerobaculia bacterium]